MNSELTTVDCTRTWGLPVGTHTRTGLWLNLIQVCDSVTGMCQWLRWLWSTSISSNPCYVCNVFCTSRNITATASSPCNVTPVDFVYLCWTSGNKELCKNRAFWPITSDCTHHRTHTSVCQIAISIYWPDLKDGQPFFQHGVCMLDGCMYGECAHTQYTRT